jgi:hypothetical protein
MHYPIKQQPIVLLAVTTAILICVLHSAGFAQEYGIFIGKTNNSISGPWSLRESSYYGGSYEHPLWYELSFEQRIGYMSRFPEPKDNSFKTGSLLSDSNLNLNLPMRILGMVPYVTAGVGFVRTIKGEPYHIGTNLDVNYGGGVKFFIPSTPFGLRLDLRLHHIINVIDQKDAKTFEYSAGVLYRNRKG